MSSDLQKLKQYVGDIAVVGERELVIGYRLLGIEDTYVVSKENAFKIIQDLINKNKYSLIIISGEVRKMLSQNFVEKLESLLIPLVVFLPTTKEEKEEPLAELAKKVLGVDILKKETK
jgi:Archaeal/vacuolar-type H+-ATPase subunit F